MGWSKVVSPGLDLLRKHAAFLLACCLVLPLYIGWFKPGVIVGADFQIRSQEYLVAQCSGGTWDDFVSGGTYTVEGGDLAKLPIFFFSCSAATIFPYDVVERLVWLFPYLLLSVLCPYLYFKRKSAHLSVVLIGTLIVAVNPALLERIHRSHVWLGTVIALFPLALLLVEHRYYANMRRAVLLGLLLAIMTWYELRTAALSIALLVVVAVVQEIRGPRTGRPFVGLFVSFLTLLALNMFWLIPTILAPPSSLYDPTIGSLSSLLGSGKDFGSLVNALSVIPSNWQTGLALAYLAIPVIWFLVNIKYAGFRDSGRALGYNFMVVALLFFSKGTNLPLPAINLWVLQNVPLFVSYRNPSKFAVFIPIFMAYVIVVGMSRWAPSFERRTRALVCIAAILATYAGCSFLIGGLSKHFEGDPKNFQNEPNMFYPMPPTAMQDLNELYASLEAQPAASYLMLPRDQRYRLVSGKVREIKVDEADKKTFSAGGVGELFSGEHRYLSNRLSFVGASGVVIHTGTTPEWNYSKQLGYSKVLQAMLNAVDMQPIREPKTLGRLQASKVIGTRVDADVVGIPTIPKQTMYRPRSLVLELKQPLSETVQINLYGANTKAPIVSTYQELNIPQAGQYVVLDWPQTEGAAHIEISGSLHPNTLQVVQGYVLDQGNNAFIAKATARSATTLLPDAVTATASGSNYDKANADVHAVAANNSLTLRVQGGMQHEGWLRTSLVSPINDTVKYSIVGPSGALAMGQAELKANEEKIIRVFLGKEKVSGFRLSNIYPGNSVSIKDLTLNEAHPTSQVNAMTYKAGPGAYLAPDTLACQGIDTLILSSFVIIDHPGSGIQTVVCKDGEAQQPIPAQEKSGSVTEVTHAPHDRRVTIHGVHAQTMFLLFDADYATHWNAQLGTATLEHVHANFGKNAWEIDPRECTQNSSCSADNTGSLDTHIELRYTPQKLLFIGAVISLFSLAFCTALMLFWPKALENND